MSRGVGATQVRYRADVGFEARCTYCKDWWPLDLDHWYPKHGLRRCKGCWAEYKKFRQREYVKADGVRVVTRFKNAMYYQANKERLRAANQVWKAANKERIAEYNREYRARKKAA